MNCGDRIILLRCGAVLSPLLRKLRNVEQHKPEREQPPDRRSRARGRIPLLASGNCYGNDKILGVCGESRTGIRRDPRLERKTVWFCGSEEARVLPASSK